MDCHLVYKRWVRQQLGSTPGCGKKQALGTRQKTMSFAFAAEATLGKLAKWLRMIGFDTIYAPENSAEALAGPNGKPRICLTRTRQVSDPDNSPMRVLVVPDNPYEQLKEVIGAVGIVPEDLKPFSRCIRCNILIQQIDKAHVQGLVPDHILETHHIFRTCTGCGRIYWPGTHTERSRKVIKKLFE